MDSEHVAPKGDVSRTLPVAVDWWKAVFKETKRTLVRGRPWRYGGEEGDLSFVISMRSGIGSGPLRFVPLEWLSTTGRPARLTKRRQIAHSLNLSSNTLFPVGY